MVSTTTSLPFTQQNARSIPKLTHEEAGKLAKTELARVLAVVESLSGEDWSQPTDCTQWTVRDMVAHLAGACAGSAKRSEFFRQMVFNPYVRTEPAPVDGANRRQIEDRAHKTAAEVVAELRDMGPQAIRNRQRLPWLVRNLRFPFGAPLGIAPISYLTDNIYTRDQWMHRADLCRATGKRMHLTADHDARVVELVLRDLARQLPRSQATIDLNLTGDVSLAYRFGDGSQADATITIDLIEFNRLASERATPEDALALATITGDPAQARWFLEHSKAPY